MAYSITNLDTGHVLSFGGVSVGPSATLIVTEDRLASLGAGGIAYFNSKVVAGLASVTYLGYTAPKPDTSPAGSTPVTPVSGTYSQAANPIPLDVRYASPFGQALALAATSSAAAALLGVGSATLAATTSALGAVKQATDVAAVAAPVAAAGTYSTDYPNLNTSIGNLNTAVNAILTAMKAAGQMA